MRREHTGQSQPLVRDLALQQLCGAHLAVDHLDVVASVSVVFFATNSLHDHPGGGNDLVLVRWHAGACGVGSVFIVETGRGDGMMSSQKGVSQQRPGHKGLGHVDRHRRRDDWHPLGNLAFSSGRLERRSITGSATRLYGPKEGRGPRKKWSSLSIGPDQGIRAWLRDGRGMWERERGRTTKGS